MSQQKIEIIEAKIKFIQSEYYLVCNQIKDAEKQNNALKDKWSATTGIAQELVEYESNLITGRIDTYKEMADYYKWKVELQQDNIKEYKKEMPI